MSWRDHAACLGRDPELFFPLSEIGPAALQLAEAQQVCLGCPVRLACLSWALQHGTDHGVWGGSSETERRGLRRRAAPDRAVAAAGGGRA